MENQQCQDGRSLGLRPQNVVSTEDYDFVTPEEAEVFNNTVGIKRRHIAPDSVCASNMCQKAAERLLEELGWEA